MFLFTLLCLLQQAYSTNRMILSKNCKLNEPNVATAAQLAAYEGCTSIGPYLSVFGCQDCRDLDALVCYAVRYRLWYGLWYGLWYDYDISCYMMLYIHTGSIFYVCLQI